MTSPHLCKLRARTAAVAALSALLLGASGSASAQPALSEWTAGVLEERGFVVVPGEFTDFASGGILACILGYADPDVNAAVIRSGICISVMM